MGTTGLVRLRFSSCLLLYVEVELHVRAEFKVNLRMVNSPAEASAFSLPNQEVHCSIFLSFPLPSA